MSDQFIQTLKKVWRPLMAITLVMILFLYLVVGFFLTIFGIAVPVLADGAWALLSVFAGSYTLSRGAEKLTANMNYGRYNRGVYDTPVDEIDDVTEIN